MNLQPGYRLDFILSVFVHSLLPVLSLVLVGIGGWFIGMRALVSNIVTEDYVVYAELGGVSRTSILASYVMRNALMPQMTGLAIVLGSIFNGAIITEVVFGYPGLGRLLVSGVESRRLQPRARHHDGFDRHGLSGGLSDRLALPPSRPPHSGRLSDVQDHPRPLPLQPRIRRRRNPDDASC